MEGILAVIGCVSRASCFVLNSVVVYGTPEGETWPWVCSTCHTDCWACSGVGERGVYSGAGAVWKCNHQASGLLSVATFRMTLIFIPCPSVTAFSVVIE